MQSLNSEVAGGTCSVINYFLRQRKVKNQTMRNRKSLAVVALQHGEEEESFTVDSLLNSETTIRIIRRTHRRPRPRPPLPDNPYIHRGKSYSKRGELRELAASLELMPLKRPKLAQSQEQSKQLVKSEMRINQPTETAAYFSRTFWRVNPSSVTMPQTTLQLRYPLELPVPNLENTELNLENLKEIEIITNDNSKQPAFLHQALLQANNPVKLQGRHFFDEVPNPFDLEKRTQFMKSTSFNTNYRSGYAPIELQENNETDNTKTGSKHFIKKKQSTLSLPRTCGVSYVKPSESEQGEPFAPLPPLIFQCSSSCDAEAPAQQTVNDGLTSAWLELLDTSWLLCAETDEQSMREMLLGRVVGKLFWVRGIQNLWPLLAQGIFIAVAIVSEFQYEQHSSWEVFHKAQLKIGILSKKSTSGKKSFFKSIGLDIGLKEDDQVSKCPQSVGDTINEEMSAQDVQGVLKTAIDRYGDECASFLKELSVGRTVTTLSLRMEMYVKQEAWPSYSKQTKNRLNQLILATKSHLEGESLRIIQKRYRLFKSADKNSLLAAELKNIRELDHEQQHPRRTSESTYDLARQDLGEVIGSIFAKKEANQERLLAATKELTLEECMSIRSELWSEKGQSLKMPLYYISTRDSFAFDLIAKETFLKRGDRCFTKTEYYFDPDNLPTNYGEFRKLFPNLDVGVTCYNDFFTNEELKDIQQETFNTEKKAFLNSFLQMTVQPTIVGSKIKRTKFFFGYRYMWTRCQLAEPNSYIGAGVRKDVTPPPGWVKKVEDPLVDSGIVEKDFINSVAINVYHDGKEGLAQHFDDAVRFKQPIYTVRLFSDARLSFGSQLYGFCNGAFVVPLPRGCILVMKENSYAANGVKHCVRPCDMTGKSAAIILRQMHSLVTNEVDKYDESIDFPLWLSTLSAVPNAVSYADQKRREAEHILENGKSKPIPT